MEARFGKVITSSSCLETIVFRELMSCRSKTCNEAVRGSMGLESLSGWMDRAN